MFSSASNVVCFFVAGDFFLRHGEFLAVFWTCFLLAAYFWRSTMGFIPVFVVPFSKRYCNIFLKMWK